MEGAISQLHSLRNGYARPSNTIPRQNHKQSWPTIVGSGGISIPAPMNFVGMHMIDPSQVPMNLRKTAGSDSGSSTGEASPPPIQPDPTAGGLHGNANQTQSSGSLRNKQPLNLSRLNGGKHGAGGSSSSSAGSNNNNNNINNNLDFNGIPTGGGALVTSNSSGNLPLLIGTPMQSFPGYRTMTQQRPFQPNGEIIYSFNPPFLPAQTPVVVTSSSQRASPSAVPIPTPYPTSKMVQRSCFNCGSTTHTGLNCSEASMEDVTRNAVYKLDYTVSMQPPNQFAQQAAMTPSASSTSLNQATTTLQPANNNEPDPTITFIDLTQDTTSSSSSSSTSSIHGAK